MLNQVASGDYSVRMHSVSYREKEDGVADRVIEGTNVRQQPSASTLLPGAALGYGGGGQIETDPRDEQGRISKKNYFTVYIDPVLPDGKHGEWVGPPGERVKVRFRLPRAAAPGPVGRAALVDDPGEGEDLGKGQVGEAPHGQMGTKNNTSPRLSL